MAVSQRPVALIGFMGSGKSTLGPLAASQLGLPFADTDTLCEALAGCTIADIFSKDGESAFRRLEARALVQAPAEGLVACGGGICKLAENRRLLQTRYHCIWLDCGFDEALRRIQGSNRPLVHTGTPESLRSLYHQRLPLYRESAHLHLSTLGSVEDALARLVEAVSSLGL